MIHSSMLDTTNNIQNIHFLLGSEFFLQKACKVSEGSKKKNKMKCSLFYLIDNKSLTKCAEYNLEY